MTTYTVKFCAISPLYLIEEKGWYLMIGIQRNKRFKAPTYFPSEWKVNEREFKNVKEMKDSIIKVKSLEEARERANTWLAEWEYNQNRITGQSLTMKPIERLKGPIIPSNRK